MGTRICVDVGGTFTDAAVLEEDGNVSIYKAPTTPDRYFEGVMNALKLAATSRGKSLKEFLPTCTLIHGTTISTNAIITRNLAKVGLICTKGFRDTLLFREGWLEGYKESAFEFDVDYPEPFVPRYLTLPVTERINSEGGIETPLDEDEVRHIVKEFRALNVEAVAVSLLWSIANPIHEKRIEEIVLQEWPEVDCVISSEVNPIIREYRRAVTTCMEASLRRLMKVYIAELAKELRDAGYDDELQMLASSGGIMSAEEIMNRTVYTIDSGPAVAPIAGRELGIRELAMNNVITMDMGGTSFDVGVIRRGRIGVHSEGRVRFETLGISKVDVKSIGAGGGSIAWVDPGGLIHTGPQSAGAVPGPACYASGGQYPTVTDADLILGYLDADFFLGGRLRLDYGQAATAVDKIAEKLNLSRTEAAYTIYSTVNSNAYSAVYEITVKQGIDPREYLMIGGGGCAGIHIAAIADMLKISQALVPRFAAGFSALGGLRSDLVAEFSKSHYTETRDFDHSGVKDVIDTLKKQGIAFLDRSEVPAERRMLELTLEARYPYEVWEISVPITDLNLSTEEGVAKMVERFHDEHFNMYANKEQMAYLECITWRIRATGKIPSIKLAEQERRGQKPSSTAFKSERQAYFGESNGVVETSVYLGSELNYGNQIAGPAIIEEETTTILIPPEKNVSVTQYGNYLLKIS